MTNSVQDGKIKPPEGSPNEIFRKMIINNQKQDQRLSSKLPSIRSISYGNTKDDAKRETKFRFVICTLGLLSLVISQMSRMVLNFSITSMVDPSMLNKKEVSSDGSCPWPVEEATIICPTSQELSAQSSTIADSMLFYMTTVGSDQTEIQTIIHQNQTNLEIDSQNFIATTTKFQDELTVTSPNYSDETDLEYPVQVNKFKWTTRQQTVLLGGFYYSYFIFMILGGRMAEVYGAKYVLFLSVAGSSAINLLTPWMARNSFNLLVISRVIMGAIQSGVFPGMYALIAKWLTISEASIYAPLIKMNLRLGMLLGSLVPGLMQGWPEVFYFTGIFGFIWSILWFFIATSNPIESRWVSEIELNHIMKKKKQQAQDGLTGGLEMTERNGTEPKVAKEKKASLKTPWLKIIIAPSVIGLIVVKLTFNYALDFISILLPSYLKYVHHASSGMISSITSIMFSMQVLLVVFVGWLAKIMVKKPPFGASKTTIRKMFQALASFGIGITMFLITFNNCNIIYVGVFLQIASFLSMFTAGGETMLPYDLSDEYPATIMAIANSVANVSGITTTVLAGLILGEQGGSYRRWNILIYLIACANMIGGLTFTALIKAEPIVFSSKQKLNSKIDIEYAPSCVELNVEETPKDLATKLAQISGLPADVVISVLKIDDEKPETKTGDGDMVKTSNNNNEKTDTSDNKNDNPK